MAAQHGVSPGKVRQMGRQAFSLGAELARLGAVYIGIAVLVTVIITWSIPSLRSQVRHVQLAMVSALQPAGYHLPFDFELADAHGQLDASAFSTLSPIMASDELTWSDDAPSLVESDAVTGGRVESPHLNFTQALAESVDESPIPGVTRAQAQALRSYIARKYRIASNVAGAIIGTVFRVGRERGLDPQLLLAVIAIESRYNPYAESHAGAQGLMQVMTKVHEDKFAAFGEGPMAAVHPLANIQVGSQILADCLERRGSLDGALACYVGATGPSDGGYGKKVKAEWHRIALASGIPVE
ncbi:MAG TPA: lytic transglycosylase domain-containing protein [Burkholderiaceae bacterium]|nr:lytic transglycosylase domain-containing protein [Burkholderiaceae bacterium]